MTQDQSAPTAFERVGGAPAVSALVERFYALVLADPNLAPYFDGIDLDRLKRHQRAFVGVVLGGPAGYGGRELADAHQGFAIGDAAFDRVAAHLATACREVGVPDDVTAATAAAVEGLRPAVTSGGRPTPDPGPAS